ncbi:MAG TPA: transmembrane sensor domain-containing protein [Cyanobacteria bacterium UBA11372]|nr:transmembrane sensor domain-containing protein [Cyanobacteria bacterium UBA11372]
MKKFSGRMRSKFINLLGDKLKLFARGKTTNANGNNSPQIDPQSLIWQWRGALIVTPCVAGITIAIRLLGWLQPLELAALDANFRLRPLEPKDERIVIVSLEESDISTLKKWPISDAILARVLTKIKQQKPRAIGLDLYRNLPVEPGHKELVKIFETTPNLIGIKKVIGDKFSDAIAPSPILAKLGQISANDVVVDPDGVVRRGILFPIPGEPLPSLGFALAAAYLKLEGITPLADSNGYLKLGSTVFKPFEKHHGGYVRADAGGYQILLNFRGSARSFTSVSVVDVLDNRIPPDLMRDRIVLIGAKAPSLNDVFYTPFSGGLITTPVRTAGVEIQANLTSQILSTVLDNRPLIQVLPVLIEELWTVLWAGIIAAFGWKHRDDKNYQYLGKLTIAGVVSALAVAAIAYASFLAGWWIPSVPPLLALLGSAVAISGYVYVSKLQEMNVKLEQTVQNLELALRDLQQSQIQLIQSEKMSTLGQLVAGVAHEVNNPVGFVSGNLNYVKDYIQDLTNHLELYQEKFSDPGDEIAEDAEAIDLEYLLEDLPKLVTSMQSGINRIKDISTSLRTFSRGDTAERVACNIHEGIDSTLLILKHRLKANERRPEIQIIKQYSELPPVNCYPGQLNQVIMNLIANAIDALDEFSQGRSFTEIEANPNKITVITEVLADKTTVAIRIKDNGPGISEEIKQKIFEHLFTTKPVGKGTGLGLSISRQIVEETHGGKLSCVSAPGEGAEFTIEIPLD